MKPRNNPKASQGGLTSPNLYDSGPDFFESQSQKVEGTACANQLHKCHKHLVKCPNYITPESVAYLSHLQNQRESSVANMFSANRCSKVTLQKCHVNVANMFSIECCRNVTVTQKPHKNRLKCHVAQIPHTPTDGKPDPPPVESQRPHRGNHRPHQRN